MKCKAIACNIGASIRGYCTKCYGRRRRHGHYGRVDAGPARKHVLKLQSLGWTLGQIDTAAGTKVATYLASGRTKMVLPETAAKILAVTPVPQAARFPGVGFKRRAEALAWMGWSQEDIARMAGLSVTGISKSAKKDTVAAHVFEKLRDAYVKYENVQGPSRLAAARARTAGYAPPAAWQYVDIDDPKAKPYQGFARSA